MIIAVCLSTNQHQEVRVTKSIAINAKSIIKYTFFNTIWGWVTETHEEFNPLNPKSDQHQISPNNITPESHIKVMRIKEMITNGRSF